MLNLTPVSELFLQVRFPGEIHDVKEFVQPKQWHVQQLISDLKKQGPVTPELLWDWVCRNVQYPLDFRGHANEYHKLDAYAIRPVYIIGWGQQVIPENRQVVWGEWFDWPWEILSAPKMVADCDGDSVLLASLIRGLGEDAYVAIGGFAGESDPLTHAWVVHNSQVWEVTAPEAGFALPEDNDVYIPLMYFNDERVLVTPELYGILKEMDYIPSIGNLCQNFGFGCDDCKKRAAVLSFHQKLKYSGIQSTVRCGAR
jgi:hypothetical protein